MRTAWPRLMLWISVGCFFGFASACWGQVDIERPPINYSETPAQNSVSDLVDRLNRGEQHLQYEESHGYLKALLDALDISPASQCLVFSKTSLQIRFISPQTPRAIYFNDETYVGWVQGSPLMEISTIDPKLGAAFYTLNMKPEKPEIKQAFYTCMTCHTSTLTQGVPGHTVRSVFAKNNGTLDLSKRSFLTSHSSPFSERWGGWYVTGLHGDMKHMGNATLKGGTLESTGTQNRKNLRDRFDTTRYLTGYSDIVSLMVLEHQTRMHNTLTRANFETRKLKFDFDEMDGRLSSNDSKTEDAGKELQLRIKDQALQVVKDLMFVGEPTLTHEIRGSRTFARQFESRGPFDSHGRSLRQFDLENRLFRFPCSYLIYSKAFESLEEELLTEIYNILWQTLNGKKTEVAHSLDRDELRAILEILQETKSGLPEYWRSDGQN